MDSSSAQSKFKYAWCALYYRSGINSYECGQARKFFNKLSTMFHEKTFHKYKVFDDWRDAVGENKLDFPEKVIKQSKYVLALFTPSFKDDVLGKLWQQQAFVNKNESSCFIPVAIDGSGAYLANNTTTTESLIFLADFMNDSPNWMRLLTLLTRKEALRDVYEIQEIPDEPLYQYRSSEEAPKRTVNKMQKLLTTLSGYIGSEWMRLGISLGLDYREIQQIQMNYRQDIYNAVLDMLNTWNNRSEKTEEERIKELKQELEECGRTDLKNKVDEILQGLRAKELKAVEKIATGETARTETKSYAKDKFGSGQRDDSGRKEGRSTLLFQQAQPPTGIVNSGISPSSQSSLDDEDELDGRCQDNNTVQTEKGAFGKKMAENEGHREPAVIKRKQLPDFSLTQSDTGACGPANSSVISGGINDTSERDEPRPKPLGEEQDTSSQRRSSFPDGQGNPKRNSGGSDLSDLSGALTDHTEPTESTQGASSVLSRVTVAITGAWDLLLDWSTG